MNLFFDGKFLPFCEKYFGKFKASSLLFWKKISPNFFVLIEKKIPKSPQLPTQHEYIKCML
jgi:hypothetical protein